MPFRSNIDAQEKELKEVLEMDTAIFYAGKVSESRIADTELRIRSGKLKIVYSTVETFLSSTNSLVKNMMRRLNRDGFFSRCVIDEHDYAIQTDSAFRPLWTKLDEIRRIFPKVPICASSAVTTAEALIQLVGKVGLSKPVFFAQKMAHKHIELNVERKVMCPCLLTNVTVDLTYSNICDETTRAQSFCRVQIGMMQRGGF